MDELVVSLVGTNNGATLAIALIISFPLLYVDLAMLALFVRRLHDTNRSGWWMLIVFVPYAGLRRVPDLARSVMYAANRWLRTVCGHGRAT